MNKTKVFFFYSFRKQPTATWATGFGATMTQNICTVLNQQAGLKTKDHVHLDGCIAECVRSQISAELAAYFYVMCTTSLSNQRGFTFSHLHDKSSCVFCETTPPIRIECPLFVLSLASRSFIHGEALKLTRILLFPLPFCVPLPESKKKQGLIHSFRNECLQKCEK